MRTKEVLATGLLLGCVLQATAGPVEDVELRWFRPNRCDDGARFRADEWIVHGWFPGEDAARVVSSFEDRPRQNPLTTHVALQRRWTKRWCFAVSARGTCRDPGRGESRPYELEPQVLGCYEPPR